MGVAAGLRAPYRPGVLGASFVLPTASGLRGLYLRWFGIPDVRVQLTATYLMDALARHAYRSLLDVGCGNGMLTCLVAASAPSARVVGVDHDGAGVEFGRRLAEQNHLPNVQFRAADIEHDAVVDRFDVIAGMAVLQFVRDLPGMLRRFHDTLTPGGRLLLQIPVRNAAACLMRSRRFSNRLPDFGEARGPFTRAEIEAHLKAAGFDVEETTEIIKGPAIVAKELFYIVASIDRRLSFLVAPVLNWITVFDARYRGRGQGLFVVARKAAS